VVCDCLTAQALSRTMRPVVFRVLSEASLEELRDYQEYLGTRARGAL
jgi:hypothetical protein